MDIDDISTLQLFNTEIKNLTKDQIIRQRQELFSSLNGDTFYPIKLWPMELQLLFWKKPIGDADTFKLFLFFIGNGCPSYLISKWILTSQHWSSTLKGQKRARQIDFIKLNLTNRAHDWFYFDLHYNAWLHLNGRKRNTIQ